MTYNLGFKGYKKYMRLYIFFLLREIPNYCIIEKTSVENKTGIIVVPLDNREFKIGINFFLKRNLLFIGSFSLYQFLKGLSYLKNLIVYKCQLKFKEINLHNFFKLSYYVHLTNFRFIHLLSIYNQILKIIVTLKKRLIILFKNDNINSIS